MRILLDCRPIQAAGSDSEKNRLIVSAVTALSAGEAIEWLFLVDHTYQPGALKDLPDLPAAHIITARGLPGTLGWKLWYDWQLPRLLKRYKPDLLMLTGGVTAKPSAIRQCIWMPAFANPKEAAIVQSAGATPPPEATPSIYAARLGSSLRNAETVFCFSERDKTWLAGRGHIDAANIHVVRPSPAADIRPMPIAEKEAIKRQYTGGKEYFFIPASGAGEEDIVHLLKAFSLFKKRQLSNLQLVIAGTQTESLQERLQTYRYRGDIHWASPAGHARTDPPVVPAPDLMAAAYAVLFPFEDGSLGTSLLNAWKARVPALVARSSRLHEIADHAAVTAGIDDPAALAGYMMAIYKDETQRNALIENGTSRLAVFDPSPSLAAIRSIIGREINKIK